MREPIDSGIETANAVAQTLRQHRDHTVWQINAVSAPTRFSIERTAGLYVSGNIGNVHTQLPTVLGLLDMNRVIKIACIIGIDGDDKLFAQIVASIELLRIDFFGNTVRLVQNISRKFCRQMIFADNRQHVDTWG